MVPIGLPKNLWWLLARFSQAKCPFRHPTQPTASKHQSALARQSIYRKCSAAQQTYGRSFCLTSLFFSGHHRLGRVTQTFSFTCMYNNFGHYKNEILWAGSHMLKQQCKRIEGNVHLYNSSRNQPKLKSVTICICTYHVKFPSDFPFSS